MFAQKIKKHLGSSATFEKAVELRRNVEKIYWGEIAGLYNCQFVSLLEEISENVLRNGNF
ncbi:hypothetical protein HMPREF9682_00756 [Streptococcus intermedius F0395]|nr:hypothetical protein HMPREF9682_00756 [Streptococcus intermedius F0395]